MLAPSHRNEIDVADDRHALDAPYHDARMRCAFNRHEGVAKAARHHAEYPIVALAAADRGPRDPTLREQQFAMLAKFAIDAVDVGNACKFRGGNELLGRQRVASRKRNDHLFLE